MLNEETLLRIEEIKLKFTSTFNARPTDFFSSPGRIELLGNHTDHNHGLVMVSAINLNIIAGVKKNTTNTITVNSKGYDDFTVDLSKIHSPEKTLKGTSFALVEGVVSQFINLGHQVGGFDISMDSTIFEGAGVSSSAAYELLFCQVLNYFFNQSKISAVELARIAQYAEKEYFGKPCGLLDQMGIALGGVNYIDFADTTSPTIKHLNKFLTNYSLLLVNTGGSHVSLTRFYAEIREEMVALAAHFNKKYLRLVEEEAIYRNLRELKTKFGGRPILRAMHFYDENRRVEKAFDALSLGEEKTFLACINNSGNSSYSLLQNCYYDGDKEQYVSLALNYAKSIIKNGAVRIHGGGFAGTILCVIANDEIDLFQEKMSTVFSAKNCIKVNFADFGTTHLDI